MTQRETEKERETDDLFSGNTNRILFLAAENWQKWPYDLSKYTPNTWYK